MTSDGLESRWMETDKGDTQWVVQNVMTFVSGEWLGMCVFLASNMLRDPTKSTIKIRNDKIRMKMAAVEIKDRKSD